MVSQSLQNALNEQLKHELYSSYLYLSMAGWADAQNLPGIAQWMLLQADEERAHAMKFYHFIQDRGGRVALQALQQPPQEFDSPTGLFEQVLAHEQEITSLIEQLYRVAEAEQDRATQVFLEWFISEQVEEERSAGQVLDTLRTVGDNKVGLLIVDRELGQRQAAAAGA